LPAGRWKKLRRVTARRTLPDGRWRSCIGIGMDRAAMLDEQRISRYSNDTNARGSDPGPLLHAAQVRFNSR
jgi:hypothetical protein